MEESPNMSEKAWVGQNAPQGVASCYKIVKILDHEADSIVSTKLLYIELRIKNA